MTSNGVSFIKRLLFVLLIIIFSLWRLMAPGLAGSRLSKMDSPQTSHGGDALAQRDGLHEAVPLGDGVLK